MLHIDFNIFFRESNNPSAFSTGSYLGIIPIVFNVEDEIFFLRIFTPPVRLFIQLLSGA